MVKLTVLLLRCGEDEEEVWRAESATAEAMASGAAHAYEAENEAVAPDQSFNEEEEASEMPGSEYAREEGGEDADTLMYEEIDYDLETFETAPPKATYEPTRLTLSERVDPFLSEYGYEQAHIAWMSLFRALVLTDYDRRLAMFCAPLKSCTGTALMSGCGGCSNQNILSWRLTTIESNSRPTAIPCVVVNGLCNGTSEIIKLGGDQQVVKAGLLHGAAERWNDGREKCPLMHQVKYMKQMCRPRVEQWIQEGEERQAYEREQKQYQQQQEQYNNPGGQPGQQQFYPPAGGPPQQDPSQITDPTFPDPPQQEEEQKRGFIDDDNAVDQVHFLRLAAPEQTCWSLEPMAPQVSIILDFVEPKKYMSPPRQGSFDPKHAADREWKKGAKPAIHRAVWSARQAGCDTVFMVVPPAAMHQMLQYTMQSDNNSGESGQQQQQPDAPQPCSLASFSADIDDDSSGLYIDWTLHGYYTVQQLETLQDPTTVIPPFEGYVQELIVPPEDQDPDLGPAGEWDLFPPPLPEYIPKDYPKLAPFKDALFNPPPPKFTGPGKKPKPPPIGSRASTSQGGSTRGGLSSTGTGVSSRSMMSSSKKR